MAENSCNHGTKNGPIRPNLSFQEGVNLVRRLYKLQDVTCVKEFMSYDNQNFLIEARKPGNEPDRPLEKFVLKLTNSEDSEKFELHQQLNEVMLMVKGSGIQCCWPIKNASGKDLSLEKLSFRHKDTEEMVTGHFLTRIMSYIPGQSIGSAPLLTAKICFEAGELLGKISSVFQDYSGDKTPFVERGSEYMWSLNSVPRLRALVHVVKDASQRIMVGEILDAFEQKVVTNKDKLTKGFVHGDFNDYNILVREQPSSSSGANGDDSLHSDDDKDVVGIIDFDDLTYSYIIYDIAVAIMYLMQCSNLERDPLESAGIMLAGYLSERSLTEAEWGALYYCVAGRFIQSLIMGLYTYSLQPQNTYLLSTQKVGWQVLFYLWGQEVSDVCKYWRSLIDQYNK